MALQVWLPLNGNLDNNGLSDITVINHGATVDDNGKIGKCYSFDGTDDYIDTGWGNNHTSKNLSICLWVKPLTSLNNKIVFGVLNGTNQRLYLGVKNNTYNIAYRSHRWGRTSNAPVTINVWSHLVITVDNNGSVLLYQDSILTNETYILSTDFNLSSNIFLGGRSDGCFANCLINDFRIYDHCLSPKEIHEISKGLILHYKLDDEWVDYKRLEYIEGTGTQCINTNYPYNTTNNTYKIECKWKFTGVNYTYQAPYGAYIGENYKTFRIIRGNSDTKLFGYSNSKAGGGNQLIFNQNIFQEFTTVHEYNTIIINGITYNLTNAATANNGTSTFYIMSQSQTSCISKIKIWYFKIFDSNILKMYLIPVCRKSDGAIGMYDTISKQFFENSGTGTFIAGPAIESGLLNLIPFELSSENYTQTNYSSRTSSNITNGVYHVDGYQSSSNIDTYFAACSNSYITLESDTDYYLSFKCRLKSANSLYFDSSSQYAYTGLLDESGIYYRPDKRFTVGTNCNWVLVVLKIHTGTPTRYKISLGFDTPNIYGSGSYIEFSNVVLSLEEPPYNNFDSSGYGNNGILTGNLQTNTDSPRYDRSTLFNDCGILTDYTNNGLDTFTYSAWIKLISYGSNDVSCISIGGTYFTIKKNGKLSVYAYGKSPAGYHDGNTVIPLNIWTHVAVVWTTSQVIGYVNGEQDFSVNCTGTFFREINPTHCIGSEYGNGISRKFNGYISDLREYVTALSPIDIKELYDTSAFIDNQGNLDCFEIKEVDETQPNILKNGEVDSYNFMEIHPYLYLPAGSSVDSGLYYNAGDTCKAETIIRYSGGSGRDLMGYSAYGLGYWGVKADGTWEPHGTFTYTNSDINVINHISYTYYSTTVHGTYTIGKLNNTYSVRNKYIYRVRLYRNGILERDLHPSIENSVYGLFDILNGVFYPSSGSGVTMGYEEEDNIAKIYKNHIKSNQIIEI